MLGNDSGTFSTYPVIIGVNPTKGTVTASSTGIVTYTANSGVGTDYFTYFLSDVTGRTSTAATVAVTISARASADGATTGQGRAASSTSRATMSAPIPRRDHVRDRDFRAGPRERLPGHVREHHVHAHGDSTGTDSFKYTITDTSALVSNEVTATVTVYPPPTAAADSATTNATVPVSIPVQANDTLPAGSATTSIVSATSNGSASVSGGNVTFTPNANYSGTTSFTYRLTDAYTNTSGTVTVTVVVRPTAATLPASGTGAARPSRAQSLRTSREPSAAPMCPPRVLPEHGHRQRRGPDVQPQARLHGHGHRDLHRDRQLRPDGEFDLVRDRVGCSDGRQRLGDHHWWRSGYGLGHGQRDGQRLGAGGSSPSARHRPLERDGRDQRQQRDLTSGVGFSGAVTITYRVTDIYGNSATATVSVTVNRPAAPSGAATRRPWTRATR